MNADHERVLHEAVELGFDWLRTLDKRPVAATATSAELHAALDVGLPDDSLPVLQVIRELAAAAEPGTVAIAGPRYFGFVIGGSHPVALAADWLTSAWDQNAGLTAAGPAAAVTEQVAGAWVLDLLGLPPSASFALVTGCQMAHFTALAAARHAVLARAGWDMVSDGLFAAPPITVVVGEERHVTVDRALRFLGFGSNAITTIPTDGQGRMRSDELERTLSAIPGPAIVCAQAGNVNTGAFDDFSAIADICAARGVWLHVDGAFGLWAAASDEHRHLTAGVERADSWATDAHKWLNVPYDCGIAVIADAASHRAAMSVTAEYLEQSAGADRDAMDWTPEFSRRARAFPLYAVLRTLGRSGVADLIDRNCAQARRFAEVLGAQPGIEILNDVVLNQVLVRFGDDDGITRAVVTGVQREGTCWLSGTTWHGVAAMRISVVNWSTTDADVERSAEAILRVAAGLL